MSILSRLFGRGSDKSVGAQLVDPHPWVVPATRDGAAFLRALPTLLPGGGFLYFEGTTERQFESWLRAHAVPEPLRIGVGTIWPRPDWYHVTMDPARLQEAAQLIDQHGIAFPSIHVHLHDGVRVLLQWHDAFVDDPMYVSSDIPRERVEGFAAQLGLGPVVRGEHAI